MCGSLLSKLKKLPNKVDPGINVFSETRPVKSQTKLADEDFACYEDRGFWKNGNQNGESETHFLGTSGSKNSLSDEGPSESDYSSQTEIEDAVRALDCTKPVLPGINSTNVAFPLVEKNSEHLLQSAREILAFHAYGVSSSSNTVPAQPLSSTYSIFPYLKTAVAFDIAASEEKKTVCPSARVPQRLKKRGKVASDITSDIVKEKMRTAEERKLKELERIRESARRRTGMRRPHPADVTAQATKTKIAAKQAAAEKKRNEEMENRKLAGHRVSQKITRIAEAKAFAKTQLESSIERKTEETERRKAKQQQKSDRKKKQKQLREKYAKKVKDRVNFLQL